jgi:hypothetical protein
VRLKVVPGAEKFHAGLPGIVIHTVKQGPISILTLNKDARTASLQDGGKHLRRSTEWIHSKLILAKLILTKLIHPREQS